MSIQVHQTKSADSIEESAICSKCEGDAGLRIKSWMNARKNQNYNEESRVTVKNLRCYFCSKKN